MTGTPFAGSGAVRTVSFVMKRAFQGSTVPVNHVRQVNIADSTAANYGSLCRFRAEPPHIIGLVFILHLRIVEVFLNSDAYFHNSDMLRIYSSVSS